MSYLYKLNIYILICFTPLCLSAQLFVSPSGSDATGKGTIGLPYLTIPKAVSVAMAGDTVYVRGGVHAYTTMITLANIGTTGAKYYLLAYPGERPILDFTATTANSSYRGIQLNGSYWYIKGLDLYRAGDNGMFIKGNNNIIEFCSFYENFDTGLQIGTGASNNQVINCDSYYNCDVGQGNADGFSPKLDVGTGNYFYGCRAWQNSDDGWDGYLRPSDNVTTTIENCWCFKNGYLKNGSASSGNGNGFKMGGGDTSNKDSLRHTMIIKNCLSFDNLNKGYDQNNNRGSMTLLNCTGYRNGTYNFSIPGFIRVGQTLTVENCITLASSGVTLAGVPHPVLATNSWPDNSTYPTSATSATSADFITLDTAGVRGPRKADGSLPDLSLLHLASGSQFINAGTDVGLPFLGPAPDLGAFESIYSLPVELTSFVVLSEGSNAFLHWTTVTEVDNYGFEIERRSIPYEPWQKIGFVEGSGTSNSIQLYTYTDKDVVSGRYAYRLKQIDSKGSFKYSFETEVLINTKPKQFSLFDGYPNPFNPTTTIKFSVSQKSRIVLKIFNILGQELLTLFDGTVEPGEYQKVFHAEYMASGIYLSVLDNGAERQVKKLVLMK